LAKVKLRIFYDQMKNHRINKIKSKAYRRIKKRQRERSKAGGEGLDEDGAGGGEGADEAEEKRLRNRIEERMTLRHKNSSKWAKNTLQHYHGDKSIK
jgi:U3 small nucleolar RNA-associated protein 14